MSSVQSLREFIGERLTAAAEEIFTHVEQTICKLEGELSRQRRLLDVMIMKPHVQQKPTVLPQSDLRNQDWKFSGKQEESDARQIKEQEEEICIRQDEDPLGLKQEADILMVTLLEENEFSREEDLNNQQLQTQSFNDGQDEEEAASSSTAEPRIINDRNHVCPGGAWRLKALRAHNTHNPLPFSPLSCHLLCSWKTRHRTGCCVWAGGAAGG
ncbi:uncharacterized protein LOC101160452 isoform X2 [Oryzias latipes]|uniref:uncharacterized protein LOC101160452 isoform X2 n=1 Tax=Oryzias latipes TaxID=8090 RepID=UPI0005CBC1A9|nr:uncharacterized protein LOC101160452 isoform X2 [Oryzias latipes]